MDSATARRMAEAELRAERFRKQVEREKERLLLAEQKRPFWHRLFPFTIKIERRK